MLFVPEALALVPELRRTHSLLAVGLNPSYQKSLQMGELQVTSICVCVCVCARAHPCVCVCGERERERERELQVGHIKVRVCVRACMTDVCVSLQVGEVNRGDKLTISAGGKGQHFALAANRLGKGSASVGHFLGRKGEEGKKMYDFLEQAGVQQEVQWHGGVTRTCTTILEDSGRSSPPFTLDAMRCIVCGCRSVRVCVFVGVGGNVI